MAGKRLTTEFVHGVSSPGRYGDGGRGSFGLSLLVKFSKKGGLVKNWQQRYRKNGKYTSRGLGVYPDVSLENARALAAHYALKGRKPFSPPRDDAMSEPARHPIAASATLPPVTATVEVKLDSHTDSFRRVFTESLERRSRGFKSGSKTAKQARSLFEAHIPRSLADRPIAEATAQDIVGCLEIPWFDSPTTAQKLVQQLNATFNHALGLDLIEVSPMIKARLILGPLRKKTRHFAALPYTEVAATIEKIDATDALASTKLCFRYIVLTAVRSGEGRLATWDEVNGNVWTIPAQRMKMDEEFRVPLSDQAVDVLRQARELNGSEGLIFSSVTGRALSDSTISKLLRENGIAATVHGFRTSFKCFAAERGISHLLSEMALAHKAGSAVELAYLRTDLLERRREMMQDWADFLNR